MKRIIFNLIFFIVVLAPTVSLVSFVGLSLFAYGSLVTPERFATLDSAWMRIAKNRIYYGNPRTSNYWQTISDCAVYDDELLYVPSSGCAFENLEFSTTLSFDQDGRAGSDRNGLNPDYSIFVLGDSYAMGWGVNDDQTYSYLLERDLGIPVYNLGVSSYATVRELERAMMHPKFDKAQCVIIHYSENDREENNAFLIHGVLPEPTLERFHKIQDSHPVELSYLLVALGTLSYLKDYPSEILWFLDEIISHAQGESLQGVSEETEAKIANASDADVFLQVLSHYISLSDKIVVILGGGQFVEDLSTLPSLPENMLPLPINAAARYPVDGHYTVEGHRRIAALIRDAIESDWRAQRSCLNR